MDLEPFFDQKVNILNISLDINYENCKNSNLIFKSQHLVMNPGQGPALKCAPGHDSMKDSSIIKSYCLKRGVMDKQHRISWFGAKSGWGQILNRFAIRWPRTNLRIFWNFKLVPPKPESPHVLRLRMYASGLQGGTKLRIFWKFSIWEALWRGVPRLRIFWRFPNSNLPAPGSWQPWHQIVIKPVNMTAILAVTQ